MINSKEKNVWQDLPLRLLSAIVIIPLALFCIIYGGLPYIIMVCCLSLGMMVEWANLFRIPLKKIVPLLWVFWPIIAYMAALKGMWWSAISILALFSMIFGQPLWMGVVVIGAPGIALLWLRLVAPSGMWWVIFVVAVVIASDSFAYLSGKFIGGPKLIPSVSPGKTWSGAIGGLIAACLTGAIVAWLASKNKEFVYIGIILGIATGFFAQLGDLLESKLKRNLGVKDSGSIIPGHGGILDRLDALLMASVFVAVVCWAMLMAPSLVDLGQRWLHV